MCAAIENSYNLFLLVEAMKKNQWFHLLFNFLKQPNLLLRFPIATSSFKRQRKHGTLSLVFGCIPYLRAETHQDM